MATHCWFFTHAISPRGSDALLVSDCTFSPTNNLDLDFTRIYLCSANAFGSVAASSGRALPVSVRPKPRRATETPSWEAPFRQDRELTESQGAIEDLIALGPLRPSSSCSHKTNSGAVRNWLRPNVQSGLRALRRADRGNCRSSRCSRIPHICEGGATSLPSLSSLRSHLLWALNQDLSLVGVSS